MKVLWLVSITIPAAADACGLQAKEIGGGWLSGALGGMTAAPDAPAITVASVDARAETLTVCSKNGVSFALVPTGSVENFSALLKKIAPDLVHIWGTEYAAARTIQQVAQAAGIPVLVGIQGVMVDCALHLNDGVPARLLHSCAAQHLIDRHVPGGLLGGLWEFPCLDGALSAAEIAAWLEQQGAHAAHIERALSRKHIFTHVEWDMTAYRVSCPHAFQPDGGGLVWATPEQLADEIALPTAFRRFTRALGLPSPQAPEGQKIP